MNTMVNIIHPKLLTKPPICGKKAIATKNETMELKNLERENVTMFQSIQKELTKPTNDCNQNVIEPNSCSFQQLCSMINDLEENLCYSNNVDQEELQNVSYKYQSQLQPEKDVSINNCSSSGQTYDDIMQLLGSLEQEIPKLEPINGGKSTHALEEFLSNDQFVQSHSKLRSKIIPNSQLQDDLETTRLQLEEKEATLVCLKNELKNERKVACEKLNSLKKEHVLALQSQKLKYQGIVKRHQKFIEKLLSEKKELTEKSNALTQRIKEIDAKHQRDIKVAVERHSVEIQRAKELCAASEKIRRERWLEAKTNKIKEMTVKGLEPELRSMTEQHQLEIQNLRSIHLEELQNMDLRAIRRTNQQMEQLRVELTENHEKLLNEEKEILRSRYEEKLNEQEFLFDEKQRKYFEELQQEKEKFSQEQMKRDAERNGEINRVTADFNEKAEAMMQRHRSELESLRSSLKLEQEIWTENQQRQYNIKFEIAESKIKDESTKERDRQIEIAIERLEKESRNMKINFQKTSENKLRCLTEKYESELQIVIDNEQVLKAKLSSAHERLETIETRLEKTETILQQRIMDLQNARKSLETVSVERDNAKRVVRQEIESEKRELEDKIASLYRELTENNSNRETLMTQLYSRIKLIVTQKDLSIKNLIQETTETKKKCDHLEKLLDQQRRDYVLKSL
ncbi:centrosomal protein of 131 kDa-like [Leptopilina boulardi]|uniref:centrosomal protein of 131 kDa-like n=1 Tax=Leptopilina boulardi TaxID=63433 RepID=UPI0021F54000|nr:centrosomal protein of 131 kDa-like [Leptopilina boulardi]